MANNILVKDANGDVRIVKSTEIAGVHVAHHVIDGITTVAGEVSIAGTVPVTGSVTVTNQPSTLTISNFPAFPTTQQVSLVAGSSINIDTMPSVTLANPVTSLSINNLPSVQNVSVNNWPASQNVVITSMPQVSGSVTVSDGDGALTVDGAVSIVSLPDIAGAVEITNASLTVAGTVNVGNALTLNNSTNMIGRVELRVNGAEVEAGNALPVYVVNPGGGGGGGEVTIAAGQSVGITGNVTVQGTVGVAGEVDLGVDVVESAGLQALVVAVTEGTVDVMDRDQRELGKVTVTNTVPVTLSNTGPLPIQIANEAGDAVLGDSTPLNTKVTGAIDIKGVNGFKLSEGGGINLIGYDQYAPVSPSNGLPVMLHDLGGNILGMQGQVPLTVSLYSNDGATVLGQPGTTPLEVNVKNADPIDVNIVSGGSGGGEITIADGQSVAIDGLVKLAGLDNTLPASGANPIPVYSDPSAPVVISTDSGQQGASIYALDGTNHQLLATRPVVLNTTSGNPEYVGDTNPMPVSGEVTIADDQVVGVVGVVQISGADVSQPASLYNPVPTVVLGHNGGGGAAPDNGLAVSLFDLAGLMRGVRSSEGGVPLSMTLVSADGDTQLALTNVGGVQSVPVTGAISVSNFPATQPVSIAATVPVSGTFWQATQPISGQVTVDTTTPLDVNIVSGGSGGGEVTIAPGQAVGISGNVEVRNTSGPALRVTPPQFSSVEIGNLTLNGGATALSASVGPWGVKYMDVTNSTGEDIEYNRWGGPFMVIQAGDSRMIVLNEGGSAQIAFRRVDQSSTPVTICFEVFS